MRKSEESGIKVFTESPNIKDQKIILPFCKEVWNLGTSLTEGSGATDSEGDQDYTRNFVTLLDDALGLKQNNIAISGGSIREICIIAFMRLPKYNIMAAATIEAALNDIRKNADAPKTLYKIECGLRALLLRLNLTSAVPASDVSVTATGTWTDVVDTIGTNSDLSLEGTAKKSIVSGSTLAWTFTGNRLVIGTLVTDEVIATSGTFTIDIDGKDYGTYDGRGKTDGAGGYLSGYDDEGDGVSIPERLLPYDNSITHDAWYVDNLGTGEHTVTITTTSTTKTYIDYFGTYSSFDKATPVLLYDIPYMTPYGHSQSTVTTNNKIIDNANKTIKKIVEEFKLRNVAGVPINDFFKAGTLESYVDGIHFNNLGHTKAAIAGLSKVQRISSLYIKEFTMPSESGDFTYKITCKDDGTFRATLL